MTDSYQALHLRQRPEGLPADDDFELREHPVAKLDDQQIRVAVRHVSIDPAMRIWISEQKSYWPPVELGEVMRAAAIGEVVESRNPRFPVGAWVSGMLGVQQHYVGNGKGLKTFDAAMLPEPAWALDLFGATGLTAWFGLTDIGKIAEGETVVISAAAGSVGSAAVQIARNLGCRVIGIAGGAEKCAYVRDTLGADATIDYKAGGIGKQLDEVCPKGVDVYFDNVGGEILDAVLKRLRMRARVVVCGGISQYNATEKPVGPANYLALISARARMEGFVVIDYLDRADEAFAKIAPWVAAGKIRRQIDVVKDIAHFPQALRRLFKGENTGKQVLSL